MDKETKSEILNPTKINFFYTIQGSFILTVSFILLLLILFAGVVWIQNEQTRRIAKQMGSLRLPVSILTGKIMSEINNAAVHMRAYGMTGDKSAKDERNKVWKEEIIPALDSLSNLREELAGKGLNSKLDSMIQVVKVYKSKQDEVIQFFEHNYRKILTNNFTLDTASTASLLRVIKENNRLNEEINDKFTQVIRKSQLLVKDLLNQLNEAQVDLLKSEVILLNKNITFTNVFILITSIFAFIISCTSIYFFVVRFQKSIRTSKTLIKKLAEGELTEKAEATKDELAEVIEAANQLSVNLNNASLFALSVGEGKFDFDFKPESEKDILGNSLIQMRDKLLIFAEEDKKRNWTTQGFAKFAGIINANNSSFSKLGDALIESLIEYVGANQGGIFVLNEDNTKSNNGTLYLDLIACYAFDRKKYIDKRLKINSDYAETLVGQAYLEKEKIYMTAIPQDYIKITSGLGDASPDNLLLVPLRVNEKVEGVLELASFKKFESYQIDFIEKLCESIASSIASVKISERTKKLVENLQAQTEAMQSQEEEMRQNMEELAATQEQMKRKQDELEKLKFSLESEVENRTKALQESLTRFDLINQSASEGLWDLVVPESGLIEADTDVFWSKQLLQALGFEHGEFPNKFSSWFSVVHPEDQALVVREFINHIKDKTGQHIFDVEHKLKTKSGEYRWFRASCKTLRNSSGKALRVAGFINDIQTQKDLDVLMDTITEKNKLLEAKEEQFDKLAQNTPGMFYQYEADAKNAQARFVFVSDYAEKLFGYKAKELLKFNIEQLNNLIHPQDRKDYFSKYFKSGEEMSQFDWEGRMQHKNKQWIWVKIISKPRAIGDGKILSDGIFLNITDRKRQEEELREINTRLLASEEELRQNMEELIATQEQIQAKQKETETLNKKLAANEAVLKKAVQKNKEKELQMLVEREENRAILDSLPEAFITLDKDKMIVSINISAEKILNTQKEEIIGKNIQQFLPALNLQLKSTEKQVLEIITENNRKLKVEAFVNQVHLVDRQLYLVFLREV